LLHRRQPSRAFVNYAAAAGFLVGAGANTALTWYMTTFDAGIHRFMDEALTLDGFVELRVPRYPPLTLMPTGRGGYLRREPLDEDLPAFLIALAESAEDKRFASRIAPIDLEALGRAVFRVADGQHQGGSGLPEQLGGLLFDLHPRGLDWTSIRTKLRKFLIGVRIDELYRRDEIVHAYLAIVPFNSISGFELSGIQAAAKTFFGRDARDLTVPQAAVLLSMLPNPARYFPYKRSRESEAQFEARMAPLRQRSTSVINNAVARGRIDPAIAQAGHDQFLAGLLTYEQAVRGIRRPKLRAVFDELAETPGLTRKAAVVEVAFDSEKQAALQRAIEAATKDICVLPAVRVHGCADVAVDAVVLNADGGIVAESGLTTVAGGGSSIIKPAHAAAALEGGVIYSVHDFAPGTRIPVDEMLWRSVNEGAERLSQALGAARLVPFLEQFGFVIPPDRVSDKNALGAGAWIAPRAAAQGFVFHFGTHPGTTAAARVVVSVHDRRTGAQLFRAGGTRILTQRTALAIRGALQQTAIKGTARTAFAGWREQTPIAIKTGTSAFFSKTRRGVVGEGGSCTLAADASRRLIYSIRVRYRSGAPFEPNGGASAALVVRNFLNEFRESSNSHSSGVSQ